MLFRFNLNCCGVVDKWFKVVNSGDLGVGVVFEGLFWVSKLILLVRIIR